MTFAVHRDLLNVAVAVNRCGPKRSRFGTTSSKQRLPRLGFGSVLPLLPSRRRTTLAIAMPAV